MVAALSLDSQWTDLIQVVRDTRALIARADADFSWSRWNNQGEALSELDGAIGRAMNRGLDVSTISYLYAPTGPVQEVSLSSAWANEFLKLADRFDAAIRRL